MTTAPLVCQKCGAEYHGLACGCFQVFADNEVERHAWERFLKDPHGALYISRSKGFHILPQAHSCLSLCRAVREKRPETVAVCKSKFAQFVADAHGKLCTRCLDIVLKRMAE